MTTLGRIITTLGLSLVAGAAIGTALGILIAPQPGVRTRHQLLTYSKRAQRQATRLGHEVKAGFDRAVKYSRELVA